MAKALPKFGKRAKVARVWRALMLLAVFVCSWSVALVTVQAKESEIVIELTFDNSPFVVNVGEQGALPDLVAEYSSGIKRKVTPEAEYEVADPKVARVERVEGSIRLTGVSTGITQLTARYSGLEAKLVVYVSEPPPSVRWHKVFHKEARSEFVHVAAFPDGSFLSVGYFDKGDKIPRYTKILRITEDGKILWERAFRVKDFDTYPSHAAIGPDGKVYIVGYTSPKDINNHVFLLVLRAEDGATLWEKSLGGGDVADYGKAVVPLADGGLVVASSRYLVGYTYPYSVHLWRLDAQGNVRWEKDYRGETRMFMEKGLAVATNGDLFVAGAVLKFSDPNPKNWDWDGFLLRVNPENGSILWSVTFGEEKSGYPEGIVATDDGGVLVVGTSWSHPPHHSAAFLRKFDAQGNEEWMRIFVPGAGRSFEGVDVVALPDKSGYVFVGSAMLEVVRVDHVGNLVWLAQLGGVRAADLVYGLVYGVAVNAAGAVLIAGVGGSFHEDSGLAAFLALFDPEKRPNSGGATPPAAPNSSASLANEQTLPAEKPREESEDGAKADTTSSPTNHTPDGAMVSAPESSTSRVEKWIISGLFALLGLAAVGTGAVVLARRRSLPFRRLWDDHRCMTLGVLAVLLLIGLGSGAWLIFKSSTSTSTSTSSAKSDEYSHIKPKSNEGAVAQMQKDARLPGVEEPYCDCLADKLRPPRGVGAYPLLEIHVGHVGASDV